MNGGSCEGGISTQTERPLGDPAGDAAGKNYWNSIRKSSRACARIFPCVTYSSPRTPRSR